jgi:2-iminobutanoate/2-iminopropanoate deaminase
MPLRSASSLLLALPLLSLGCRAPATEHRVAPGALGPYSGAVVAGDLVFVSGQIGERGGTFEHEAETAVEAVRAELAPLGLDLADVVESRVFLTDIERYADFNAVYARLFPAPYPARACVAVAALPAGARVEVQCVARRR